MEPASEVSTERVREYWDRHSPAEVWTRRYSEEVEEAQSNS